MPGPRPSSPRHSPATGHSWTPWFCRGSAVTRSGSSTQWRSATGSPGCSNRVSTASRIRQSYYLVGAILPAAVESGYLAKSPCVGVKLPHVARREIDPLTTEQVDDLAIAAGPNGVLIYTLACAGLRWGELAALRRSRCNLLRGRLHVAESLADVNGRLYFGPTKTYQTRTVSLPGFLRDLLAVHLESVAPTPDALVFTSPLGAPLRLPNFRRRVWKPALDRAMLRDDTRIHDLRHTCASLLIAQGAHPKAIQTHLGHSSIAVTMDLYGHLFPDDLDRLGTALDTAFAMTTRNRREIL